jgi:hypothetical protein
MGQCNQREPLSAHLSRLSIGKILPTMGDPAVDTVDNYASPRAGNRNRHQFVAGQALTLAVLSTSRRAWVVTLEENR